MYNLIVKAIKFGTTKHDGQVRKGSGHPYISHPIAVSYIVASVKRSKHFHELLIAAILHDTLEDTDTTFTELAVEFTPLVASLVLECTNDESEIARVGKLEYQKKKVLGMSSYGLIIKLADRLHNVSDQPSAKMITETGELIKFLQTSRRLSATHKQLIDSILLYC
jgi:(p)ppGpp synthase/HD superfamily hydrolase